MTVLILYPILPLNSSNPPPKSIPQPIPVPVFPSPSFPQSFGTSVVLTPPVPPEQLRHGNINVPGLSLQTGPTNDSLPLPQRWVRGSNVICLRIFHAMRPSLLANLEPWPIFLTLQKNL